MTLYKATLTTTEVFEVIASTKEEAELMILEDLSDEQRGTADIQLEEVENDEN